MTCISVIRDYGHTEEPIKIVSEACENATIPVAHIHGNAFNSDQKFVRSDL